jgi:hypothetical protein
VAERVLGKDEVASSILAEGSGEVRVVDDLVPDAPSRERWRKVAAHRLEVAARDLEARYNVAVFSCAPRWQARERFIPTLRLAEFISSEVVGSPQG